jgi:DNA polymerase-3 subunit gamma/tau
MLGSVDRTRVGALLAALADGNGEALLAEVAALADFSPDWGTVLDALSDAMHRIQVRQLVPTAPVEGDGVDVDGLAARVRAEVIQLWYQMALNGRRDLPMAPSPRAGFEMTLLRMLAFRPGDGGGGARLAQVEGGAARGGAQAGIAVSAAVPRPSSEAARPERGVQVETPAPALATAPNQREARTLSQADVHGVHAAEPAPSTPEARPADDDVPPWAEDVPMAPATPTPSVVAAVPASASPIVVERNQPPRAVIAPALPTTPAPTPVPVATPSRPPLADRDLDASIADADEWHAFVAASELKGPARLLAEHAVFGGYADGVLTLGLPEADQHLGVPNLVKLVAEALASRLGSAPQIRFTTAAPGESIRERNDRARDERRAAAETTFMDNADVQRLIAQYGARVVPDSIRPRED